MADSIHNLILTHASLHLSHHGSLSVGRSLEKAQIAIERMEHVAYTLWVSQAFGIRIHSAIVPAAVALLATLLFWLLYDLTPEIVTVNKKKLEEMGL